MIVMNIGMQVQDPPWRALWFYRYNWTHPFGWLMWSIRFLLVLNLHESSISQLLTAVSDLIGLACHVMWSRVVWLVYRVKHASVSHKRLFLTSLAKSMMAPTDQTLNEGQSVFCPNGQDFGTNVGEIHYWGENARNPWSQNAVRRLTG